MSESIPLSMQDITQVEIDAVVAVLKSDRLSLGPCTERFEAAAAAASGRKYGVAVNSGTSGLHLCVKATGLQEGDEVITTPFSFISTTNCLLFERAKPVLVDIDPASYNMCPDAAAQAVTPKTRGLLPVEAFGNMAHFDRYEALANEHELVFIEDSCEALGGRLGDRRAGGFGDCGVFAFYPNKQLTTGEGGVVVTDREDIRDMCFSLRNQGRATEAWLSHARLGYNYRISEITAALGEVQFSRLDDILARRRQAAARYDQLLADIQDIHLPPMLQREQASWFVYVIRLADEYSQADRDSVIQSLREEGIGCNNYFVPIHLQPYIMEQLGVGPGDFPVTERIAARTIALPFFAKITEQQQQRVAETLKSILTGLR